MTERRRAESLAWGVAFVVAVQGVVEAAPGVVSLVAPQEGYVEVLDMANWRRVVEGGKGCEGLRPDPGSCPPVEWRVPVVPEEFSRRSAREVQRAWKRFQERSYWRADMAVNSGSWRYVWECWAGWWQGNRFAGLPLPAAEVSVRAEDTGGVSPPGGLSFRETDPRLTLEPGDWWASGVPPYARPAVPKADFCDGLSWRPWPAPAGMGYIENWKVCWWGFCVAGWGYPYPLNWGWGLDRMTREAFGRAVQHAYTRYYADYWNDVVRQGLAWVPWALAWQGLRMSRDSGVILQPVVKVTAEDLGRYPGALQERWRVIDGAMRVDPRAPLYYGQPDTGFPTFSVMGVGEGGTETPGIQRLEE